MAHGAWRRPRKRVDRLCYEPVFCTRAPPCLPTHAEHAFMHALMPRTAAADVCKPAHVHACLIGAAAAGWRACNACVKWGRQQCDQSLAGAQPG
eukprot:115692-Chlamydomonas_euryale.AAC.2